MPRWFVTRNGRENGPLTDAELNRAAAAGKIRPDDSVRREDDGMSRPAKEIAGLVFAQVADSLYLGAGDESASIDQFDLTAATPESGIAACLEQKERIANQLLPHAYMALGKQYYEAIDHSDPGRTPPPGVAPFVEQIDSLLLEAPTSRDKGSRSYTDPARAKAVENQLAKKYCQLGKRVYDIGGLSPEFRRPLLAIEELFRQDKILNDRIALLRVEAKKKRESDELANRFRRATKTAGAFGAAVQGAGVSFLRSTPALVLLATLVPPLGQWLIWQNPRWGVKSKLQWSGLSLACFLSLLMANHVRTVIRNAEEATRNASAWAIERANADAVVNNVATALGRPAEDGPPPGPRSAPPPPQSNPPSPPTPARAPSPDTTAARPLFDGDDLSAWRFLTLKSTTAGADKAWTVDPVQRVLRSNGGNSVDLESKDSFDDFTFHCEWRFLPWEAVSVNGSGIVVRSNGLNETGLDPAGIEIELKIDKPDDHPRKRCGGLIAYDTPVENQSGAVDGKARREVAARNLAPVRQARLVPTGQWNSTDIECRGDRLKVTINGEVVNEAWGIPVRRGHICLRNQDTALEFRNLSVAPGP